MSRKNEFSDSNAKLLKEMTFKEKIAHFWYYYNWQILLGAFLLFVAILFISEQVKAKKPILNVYFVNGVNVDLDSGSTFMDEFSETVDYNKKKEMLSLQTTINYDPDGYDSTSMANLQRYLAVIMAGDVDVSLMPRNIYATYADQSYYMDLREVLTPEQMQRFEGHFYYVDAANPIEHELNYEAIFARDAEALHSDDPYERRDTTDMEDPVPVGIFLDGDLGKRVRDAYFYFDNDETILGVMSDNHHDLTLQFIDWLTTPDAE